MIALSTQTTDALTYEAALARVADVEAQQQHWTERRELVRAELETLQAQAGAAALAGTSTSTLATRISRLQTQQQIVERAIAALGAQHQAAHQVAQQARIAELRQEVAAKQAAAAAVLREAAPHLDALERIEGVRPYFERSRSLALEQEADRIARSIEWLERRLETS